MSKKKLPKHYFAYNDGAYKNEIEETIISECESAGLDISEDEDLAEQRGYDRAWIVTCLLYTSPSPRDGLLSRMPSSA